MLCCVMFDCDSFLGLSCVVSARSKKKLLDQSHTEGEQSTGGEGRSCRCERNSAVRHIEGA